MLLRESISTVILMLGGGATSITNVTGEGALTILVNKMSLREYKTHSN
ncbi:hypothetical protein BAOM_0254 [Peribacillus asahii]|uniref:Uncharacterized protein n=1 Tax=Peribacillus asahii TaxID=228899 RepID=A0A3Q9RJD2_9BACI|nr:hypothetical protein BAOM_0254 [Peribacillus asahii]